MTANFRENVTAIWRRNVWWPSSRAVPSSSRLVSFCPSGWKKETGHASRGHEGCCKTLRLNILDVFRPATPFHPSAHPFPYSLVAGVLTWKVLLSSTTTADRLRCAAKYSFFFLFLSFYSLSSLRALMGPFSLPLAFLRSAYRLFRLRFSSPSVFLGNARAVSGRRSSFEPRVSSRLECVYLFSLIMDPLEEEEEERKGCRDYRSANSSGDDWDLGWRSRVASMNCRHCGIFFFFFSFDHLLLLFRGFQFRLCRFVYRCVLLRDIFFFIKITII